MRRLQSFALWAIAALFLVAPRALADDVQWFNSPMKDQWWDAVGEVTTIDFTGHENFEPLSDQYASRGVTFSHDGPLHFLQSGGFVNDGWGFRGYMGGWVNFDEPMNWIAADFPGALGYELYSGDDLFYTSFEFGMTSTGNFGGLISEKPFDRVLLWKEPSGPFQEFDIFVDDLHFGALAVPAPGAMCAAALSLLIHRRKRREE